MYIKSITLDGFKSYGNRVEIIGFDPAFNAITGLNGTGKSNILDSICFVLGITNLSNVRASSLQELIYKHGQAGIMKATVSITFDNRDKTQTPIGYESTDEITITRQIAMGGKNKYLINGINVQNKRVHDLFCSVQLNVNNPHFLIMQGRITKVLNMKPPEILSMIEEAAGTSMYESKKLQAQGTIARKDAKLKELDSIIKEDISPKLQKLSEERSQFQVHQQTVRLLDGVEKLQKSYLYVQTSKKYDEAEGKVEEVRDEINAAKEGIKSGEMEAKTIDKEISEINKKLDEESGGALQQLQRELDLLQRAQAAAGSAERAARQALASHDARAQLLQQALSDDVAALHHKQAALDQASGRFGSLRAASEQSEAALAAAQQRFLAVSAGLEGGDETLQDQLMAAKEQASEASTRIAQSKMRQKAVEQRLLRLREEFSSSSRQHQQDMDDLQKKQEQYDKHQSELSALRFEEASYSALQAEARALQTRLRGARDRTHALQAKLPRCHFRYSPPEPHFDNRRVYGTIARLINVPNPEYCIALETAAGGKLYNVVVDTEVTSKLLLQRGNLQARTTIIPLNKISPHVIDARTVAIAQDVGGADNVQLALSLVTCEARVLAGAQWVWGNTLVCRDLETAKRVCFHPRVRRRAVTLDGDVFDPAGTLSGGAKQQGGSVLTKLQELKNEEQELQAMERQLADCNERLSAMQQVADKYYALKQRVDMMSHELRVVRERLASTPHAQAQRELQELEAQMAALTSAVESDKVTLKETEAKVKDLEEKVKDIKGHREREFKKAEEGLAAARRSAEEHGGAWRAREHELESLQLEAAQLRQAVACSEAHLAALRADADALAATLTRASEQHALAEEAAAEMQARIKQQKAQISGRNSEVARRTKRKELLLKNKQDQLLRIQQLDFNVNQIQEDAVACKEQMRKLEKENPWIGQEKQFFGAAGGMYDFAAKQADLAPARLRDLRDKRDKLARGLNARAHTLLHKEEEQFKDLLHKKEIVEADRAKLVKVMLELDEKKRVTLREACAQVNKDFGSIFSSLLPGAQAELRPPAHGTVLDGLEVRVGFNGAWKESLSELSGGQRSLVAMSLVLAMLLFKPAPLYILDEVDAALDLSHTQNIGAMLRNHFQHSQFIIVSLKDGMFNNANVLFKTRFVDGMSAVQRTVNTLR